MEGKFTVVEKNAKLAYAAKAWTQGAEESTYIEQVQEITFAGEDGKTKMELKITVSKIGPAAGMAIQGMRMGFSQQFEKLNAYLAK